MFVPTPAADPCSPSISAPTRSCATTSTTATSTAATQHQRLPSRPRQITFHPSDPRAFVVNELDNSITAYATDEPDGGLRPSHCVDLPDAATPSIAADIQIHPEGHRIYASNRGHDSIAIFDCADPDDPLRPLGQVDSGGRTPRATVLHPSTTTFFVANQDSDTIVAFAVDPDGILHERGVSACPSAPTCLVTSELAT